MMPTSRAMHRLRGFCRIALPGVWARLTGGPAGSRAGAGSRCQAGLDRRPIIDVLEPRLLLSGTLGPHTLGLSAAVGMPSAAAAAKGPDLTVLDPHVVDEAVEFMEMLQDGLGSEVMVKLPIVGPAMAEAVRFIDDLRDTVQDTVDRLIGGAEPGLVQEALFGWLGPAGADILLDGDDPGTDVTAADILLVVTDDAVEFGVHLGGEIYSTDFGGGFQFEAGLPGLGLEVDAGVEFTVAWDFQFGFGVSLTDRYYLVSTADGEIELDVSATLTEGSQISGTLGVLQLRATDFAEDDDVGGGNLTGRTGLFGRVAVDLRDPDSDGRLTYDELTDPETPLNEMIVGLVNAGADVNLRAVVDFGSERFPSVSTDFDLDWDFLNAETSGEPVEFGGTPQLAFNDVTLDLGSFISDFIGPIMEDIQDFTKPIQPVIDILTMDIPVISDLAGPTSLLDLARTLSAGRFNTGYIDAVETVIGLVDMFNDLDLGGSIQIGFGDFPLTGVNVRDAEASLGDAQTVISPFDLGAQLSAQGTPPKTRNFIASLDGGGFEVPLLDDPFSVFQLMIGNTVDLFRYEMPTLEVDFYYEQTFYIFPGVSAKLGGGVGGAISLGFGFDTYGIQQFADPDSPSYGDPAVIFDGFYVNDHVGPGGDAPELALHAGIEGKAVVGIPHVLDVGVGGGIQANVGFDLNDLNGDGKVRGSEFADLIQLGPKYLFNMDGRVWAGLWAYLWAGLDLGFLGKITFYEDRWDIWSTTIADFSFHPLDPPPVIATLAGDGTLVLGAGPAADPRLGGPNRDERFTVRQVDEGGVAKIVVLYAGYQQEFPASAVSSIVADGGGGDDEFVIGEGVAVPLFIHGGEGNDALRSDGSGPAALWGDAGDDVLVGGSGDDYLDGGDGADQLDGRAGDDQLAGGAGSDRLVGGEGDDQLTGGAGDDRLDGGGGQDTLTGGAGADVYFWSIGSATDTFVESKLPNSAKDGTSDQLTIVGGKELVSDTGRYRRYRETDDQVSLSAVGGALIVTAVTPEGTSTIEARNIENVSVVPGGGADTVTLSDLRDTDVERIGVNVGQGAGASGDTVVYNGTEGADTIRVEAGFELVGNDVLTDDDGSFIGLGDPAEEMVVRVVDSTGGSDFAVYVQGSNSDRDRLEVLGLGGADALAVSAGNEFLRVQDLIAVALDGGDDDDALTTVYSNGTLIGGAGQDHLRVTHDPNTDGAPAIQVHEADIAVFRGGAVSHLMDYEGVEAVVLDLGAENGGNEVLVLGTIGGRTAIHGGDGDDWVTVRGVGGPLDVTGEAGDDDRLIVDRTGDVNGQTGTLSAGAVSGFGFAAGVSYAGIESVLLDLGSGADAPVIEGTGALVTTINGGGGDDQFVVRAVGGTTEVRGGDDQFVVRAMGGTTEVRGGDDQFVVRAMGGTTEIRGGDAADPYGAGDDDAVILEIPDDPNALPASPFAGLTFSVETLRVDHTGSVPTAWRIEDGSVWVGTTEIVGTLGTGLVVVDGGTSLLDSLTVASNVPQPQTVTIQADNIEIEHGWDVLRDAYLGFADDPATARSAAVSGDGRDLYTAGAAGLGGATVEHYSLDPATGAAAHASTVHEQWMLDARLIGGDRVADDYFGQFVAVDGSRYAVGAPDGYWAGARRPGKAYVFEDSPDGPVQVARLVASDGTNDDRFGSVAIDDDTVLVGANGSNSAYVFEQRGPGQWEQVAKLVPWDGMGGSFGYSLAIDGDTAVVGANTQNVGGREVQGAAYVFQKVNGTWTPIRKILSPTRGIEDYFGFSLDISDDTILIGAFEAADPSRWTYQGAAFIFQRNRGGTNNWGLVRKLLAPDGGDWDWFGLGAALDGDTAVVSARGRGGLYVYQRNQGGGDNWGFEAKIVDPGGLYGGREVAIDGDVIAHSTRSLILYRRTSPGVWEQWASMPRSEGKVALDGGTVIVGASSEDGWRGAAYVYQNADLTAGAASVAVSPDGRNVYAARPGWDMPVVNLALGGMAQQSSTYSDGLPSRATDGNTDGAWAGGSVTHTQNEFADAWWEVNLGDICDLDSIVLHNRTECAWRLSNFRVSVFIGDLEVYGVECFVGSGHVPAGGSYDVPMPGDVLMGDRVRVQLLGPSNDEPDDGYLSLAEVEVFGHEKRNAVSVFSRDAGTGELSFVEEVWDEGSLYALGATLVSVSPDGQLVYVAAKTNVVSVFNRDPATGKLTSTGFSIVPPGGGAPTGIEISADSQFVYIADDQDKLWTYRRSGVQHSQVGGPGDVPAGGAIALSPDGANLYVARPADAAVSVFARDIADGTLAFLQDVRNGTGGVRGLDGVASLVVTDNYVFAAGEEDDSLVALHRDGDGRLVFAQRVRNRAGGVQGLEAPNSLVFGPDGQHLYAASGGAGPSAPGGVAWFAPDLEAPRPADPIRARHAGVESLAVQTGDREDSVGVRNLAAAVKALAVSTGGGADLVVLPALGGADATVDLGEGADALELRGTGDGRTTVVLAGGGDDMINVWGTGVSSVTDIHAGDGGDSIAVSGDDLGAPLTVYCGDQSDLLEYAGQVHPDSLDPDLPGDGEIKHTDGTLAVAYYALESLSFLDAPPRADAGGPYALAEGGALTLDASGSTVPAGQTLLAVEWDVDGDGTFGDLTGLTPAALAWAELRYFGIDDDGEYQVAVRVTTDVAADVGFTRVVVADTPPSLALSGAAVVDQHATYTLSLSSSDPGEDAILGWSIDWGDGAVEAILSNPPAVTHVYEVPGGYTISATATDADGTHPAGNTVSVQVNDVGPVQYLIGPDTAEEGGVYTLGLDAAGAAGQVSWVIEWGDGSPGQTVTGTSASVEHRFVDDSAHAAGGAFEIRATIIDAEGIYTATKAVTVANVAPTLRIAGGTSETEGRQYTLLLESEDPGDDALRTWTVDWGDGTVQTVDAETESFQSVKHTYADDSALQPGGAFEIRVTALDEDATAAAPYAASWVGALDCPVFHFHSGPDATGHVYLRTAYASGWFDAYMEAEQFRGYLATITSAAEQRLLDAGFFDVAQPPDYLWIDALYTPGPYWNHTGEPADYQNWAPGEPDPLTGSGYAFVTLAYQGAAEEGEPLTLWDARGQYDVHYGIMELDSLRWFWPAMGAPGDVLSVSVANAAPTAGVHGADEVEEGAVYDLRIGPPSDPGDDTVTRYVVDWGDGAIEAVDAPPAQAGGFVPSCNISHIYADGDAVCGILVSLVDEDGEHALGARVSVHVVNVPPTIVSLTGPALSRAGEPAEFSAEADDPGQDTLVYTWDFGDGSAPLAGADLTEVSHVYAGDGTYTVTLNVSDGDGGADSAAIEVEVFSNVPPVVDAGGDETLVEGGALARAGSFEDPDPGDSWSATVDYGDGTGVQPLALVGHSFQLSHVYADDGQYEVSVVVTDAEGESGSGTFVVTVANAAPVITELTNSSPACGGAGEGEEVAIWASFTDAGTLDTHTAMVDWGDGSEPETVEVTETGGSGTVGATHVYEFGGVYEIALTVTDDDGGQARATTTAFIAGVGLRDGVLQIVGTAGVDHVRVKQVGDMLRVEANFMSGCRYRLFDPRQVSLIRAWLGDGDDHFLIQNRIAVPAEIYAGGGDDQVDAGGGNDVIWGGDGDDHLRGRGGDDEIHGEAGDDHLYGGAGDDVLDGGDGRDHLHQGG